MKNKSTISRIVLVVISNLVQLTSGILVGFLVPKVLGLEDYGYYKLFALYASYIGLFHFGFIDGIYLKFGGADYEELNKIKFRSYFKFLLVFETVIMSLGLLISLLFLKGEPRIIIILLSISLLITNLSTYFQFISQITSRFKEYSFRTIILASINLIGTIILYLLKVNHYYLFILFNLGNKLLLLIWYMYTYSDIVFGKREKIKDNFSDIFIFFKTGILLLIANLISTLIISLDKQVVNFFFSIEKFATYSFAYSMLVIITTAISAISVVLYPVMKQKNIEEIAKNYGVINMAVILVVVLGLFSYFPLLYIVPWILPKYVESLVIFKFALPTIIFTSSISAIKHNIFKTINKEKHFLLIGAFVLLFTFGLNIGAYYIFKKMEFITISSLLGFFIWYIITEIYLVKNHKVKWVKNFFIIIFSLAIYFISTLFENNIIGGGIYLIYAITLIFINFKDLKKMGFKFPTKRKEGEKQNGN